MIYELVGTDPGKGVRHMDMRTPQGGLYVRVVSLERRLMSSFPTQVFLRVREAVPLLCTSEQSVQARYRAMVPEQNHELFPEHDGGKASRLHALVQLPGGCFMAQVRVSAQAVRRI